MTHMGDSHDSVSCFVRHIESALKECPAAGGSVGMARAPGVVDVMGGIGEDSGGLVLTATTALAFHVAAWSTNDQTIRVRFISIGQEKTTNDCCVSIGDVFPGEGVSEKLVQHCRSEDSESAAESLLTLHELLEKEVLPKPDKGLFLLVATDFPDDADLGQQEVRAAATMNALCRLFSLQISHLEQSRICATVINRITGLYQLRKCMTALCGPPEGALLQLRFHPNLLCDRLEMPSDIIVKAVSTRLDRPTTLKRLIETRTCSEMGHRMILDLQRQDGASVDPMTNRLSSITPAEYVERYRDRMPSKIARQAFVNQFGMLRGLNDGEANPKGIYKIRSRAEHHIYENRRVHEFATHLVRSRRNRSTDPLMAAGELMYASHWSHSQRCGIGGVETDRIVNLVRAHGPEAGLYGAKVTAGGAGGELVVLMRNDDRARTALEEAVAEVKSAFGRSVHVFEGSLPGAETFEAPTLKGLVDSASAV